MCEQIWPPPAFGPPHGTRKASGVSRETSREREREADGENERERERERSDPRDLDHLRRLYVHLHTECHIITHGTSSYTVSHHHT